MYHTDPGRKQSDKYSADRRSLQVFYKSPALYEEGTPEFAREIARNVSTIIQFNSTQKDSVPVKEFCIGGLKQREDCISAVESLGLKEFDLSLNAKLNLPDGEEARDYLPELGAFAARSKGINFWQAYKKNPAR